jgi:predicted dehydrogenase
MRETGETGHDPQRVAKMHPGGGRLVPARRLLVMAVKWGIMSTARINRLFLAGAREASDAEVVAVASRDRAAAERYARDHGIDRAHGGYEAVLGDPEVEVVYISLPDALHLKWSVRALDAGKHVLCEKPLGRRAADVNAAFDVAKR